MYSMLPIFLLLIASVSADWTLRIEAEDTSESSNAGSDDPVVITTSSGESDTRAIGAGDYEDFTFTQYAEWVEIASSGSDGLAVKKVWVNGASIAGSFWLDSPCQSRYATDYNTCYESVTYTLDLTSYYVVKGDSDDDSRCDEDSCATVAAHPSTVHAVRCCSDSEITDWRQKSSCSVWAESDIWGNCQELNWADADVFCKSQGGRLCTREELEASCAEETGCGFDWALVWSSTESNAPPTAPPTSSEPSFEPTSSEPSFNPTTSAPTTAEPSASPTVGTTCELTADINSNYTTIFEEVVCLCEEYHSIGTHVGKGWLRPFHRSLVTTLASHVNILASAQSSGNFMKKWKKRFEYAESLSEDDDDEYHIRRVWRKTCRALMVLDMEDDMKRFAQRLDANDDN